MEDTSLVALKFLFLFLCVFLFSLLAFSFFRRLSIISIIGKIFFCRSLPTPKYLSQGNFRNCLPTNVQVVRISL